MATKYLFAFLIPQYYSILNGNITLDGSPLDVFDGQVPPNHNGSYILIGERTSGQTPGKTCTNFEAFVLVDVCIKGQSYGFKDSEDCANQIMGLINSDANPDCSPDFQVVTTSVSSTNNLAGMNASDYVFRTMIRFRHLVTQL